MKSTLSILILLTWFFSYHAQNEMKYNTNSSSPEWIKLMYQENPNPGLVIKQHDNYYATHAFIKNEHTQYFKRWLRALSREVSFDASNLYDKNYIKKSKSLRSLKDENSEWSCIGPYD